MCIPVIYKMVIYYYSEIKFRYHTERMLNIDLDLTPKVKYKPLICIFISVTTITHLFKYWCLI